MTVIMINPAYDITNGNPEKPPVRYSIGLSWSSGETGLWLGRVFGLSAVSYQYGKVPGLGGNRQVFRSRELVGARDVIQGAGGMLLREYAGRNGLRVLPSGILFGSETTVGSWIEKSGAAVVGGYEIAAAGIDPNSLFIENWEKLAIAFDTYPKEKWGDRYVETEDLQVLRWKRMAGGGHVVVEGDERAYALHVAKTWADTHVDKGCITPLAHLLSKTALKAKGWWSE